MKRSWGLRSISLVGRVFSLVLLAVLFVYLQGSAVQAAVPGVTGRAEGEAEGQNLLFPEELTISRLEANTPARWTMSLTAGDVITISAAPGAMVDIVLSVIDEEGTIVVDEQNLSPAGEVETIKDLNITDAGEYEVEISATQGQRAEYALMLIAQYSYNNVLRGTLFENGSRSDSLPEETDHFWFFNAIKGDRLSFTVTPADDGDPYIELYDNAGSRILTIDDNGMGEAESLEDYKLSKRGLYSIRVAEFDFLPLDYELTLDKTDYLPIVFLPAILTD